MAGKRNYEWPLATEWDASAFLTQDKSGGVTQRVSPALVETKLEADGFPKIPSPSANEVAVYGVSGWDSVKLADANIDAAAAIGWGKISKSGAVATDVGAEPALGDPGPGTWFLKTISGVRSWIASIPWGNVDKTGAVAGDIGALPVANPTATGLLTAPAIRNTGGAPNRLIKWDADGDEVASSLTDDGTTVSGTNLSASGAVDGGLSRMQSSAVSPTDQAWFGYAGLNSAGAYVGYYPGSDGAIRIASTTGKAVSIGTGAAYGQLVISDSGVASSSLAGTGTRAVAADSTGKLVALGQIPATYGDISANFSLSATTQQCMRRTATSDILVTLPAASSDYAGMSWTFTQPVDAYSLGFTGTFRYRNTIPSGANTWTQITGGSWASTSNSSLITLKCDGTEWLALFQ